MSIYLFFENAESFVFEIVDYITEAHSSEQNFDPPGIESLSLGPGLFLAVHLISWSFGFQVIFQLFARVGQKVPKIRVQLPDKYKSEVHIKLNDVPKIESSYISPVSSNLVFKKVQKHNISSNFSWLYISWFNG